MADLPDRVETALFERELTGRWPLVVLGWGLAVAAASLVVAAPQLSAGQVDVHLTGSLLTGLVFAFWGGSELVGSRRLVGALRVCAAVCLLASTALLVVDVAG
jgi:hypothetical protein